MKKIILLFLLILLTASSSYAFDFNFILKENDGTTKTCRAYDNGYVCPNENPLYLDDFKSMFIPRSMIQKIYIGNNEYKTCKQLKNGYYCPNELPVLYTSFFYSTLINGVPIINKKGILIKSDDGTEKICKVDKKGHVCSDEKQKFNPIIPLGTWEFYTSEFAKEQKEIPCKGYTNGYVCPGEKPIYVENFRSHFDFRILSSNDDLDLSGELPIITWHSISLKYVHPFEHFYEKDFQGILITDKENKQKVCKILDFDKYVQYGYVCKGEPPVILKNRPPITTYKNAKDYNVYRKDMLTNELKQITCKQKDGYYYCPGETKKSIPHNTNSYSKSNSQLQMPKYLEIPVGNGQYKKLRIEKGIGSDTIRLRNW